MSNLTFTFKGFSQQICQDLCSFIFKNLLNDRNIIVICAVIVFFMLPHNCNCYSLAWVLARVLIVGSNVDCVTNPGILLIK